MSSERQSNRLPRRLRLATERARVQMRRADSALAVTLIEAYLRPSYWRAIEYGFWALCRLCRWPHAHRITLGASQVRSEFLVEYLRRGGHRPTLWRVLLTGEHLGSAADIAAACLVPARAKSISAQYTGSSNPYYERLVRDVTAVLLGTPAQASVRRNETEILAARSRGKIWC
jgi:hypothetical protein